MKRAIAPVAMLLLGTAILLTGQGLQGVLIPVRANLDQFSVIAIGLIGGTYFLGFTIGCWKGARLLEKAGHVRVFAAMAAIASAIPLLHGIWVNLWSWALLRLVTGFCFAVLYIVIESWLNEQASDENRGRVFSAYIFINMTVLAIGQQMLLLDNPQNLTLFAWTAILISLASVPVLLSDSKQPQPVGKVRFGLKALYQNSPSGMLGSLTSGLANGAFWSLAPLFTAAMSQDIRVTAWFMTAGVLGGAAGQWPLGWLSDQMDRRLVLTGCCLGALVVALVLWLLGESLSATGLLALGFAWGAVAFPVYSISVAQANDRADPSQFVMISSGLLMMYGIGAISGPLLAAGLMALTSAAGLYLFTAITHTLLGIYLLMRSGEQAEAPVDSHSDFSDALTSVMTRSQTFEREIELGTAEQENRPEAS